MIAVVSSSRSERLALSALCTSRGWTASDFDSVHTSLRQFNRFIPKVILLRHKLADGYSDDIMPKVRLCPGGPETKIIVLVDVSLSSVAEARQLSLGADCVLRDPVRSEILTAYVEKFLASQAGRKISRRSEHRDVLIIAGACLCISDRSLRRSRQKTQVTPKEAELAESLCHSRGEVIRYESLYSDVLGRRFAGDTSNMRVLLGKLSTSFRRIGIDFRRWIEVIPKTGYRLTTLPGAARRPKSAPANPKGPAGPGLPDVASPHRRNNR